MSTIGYAAPSANGSMRKFDLWDAVPLQYRGRVERRDFERAAREVIEDCYEEDERTSPVDLMILCGIALGIGATKVERHEFANAFFDLWDVRHGHSGEWLQ